MAKYALADKGSLTLSGSGAHAVTYARASSATLTLGGAGAQAASYYRSAAATLAAAAAGARTAIYSRTASATLALGGLGSRAVSFFLAAAANLTLAALGGKEGEYSSHATGILTLGAEGWWRLPPVARFSLTFMGLFAKRPANDSARPRVRAFVEAFRLRLLAGQSVANAVFWAAFPQLASGGDLDRWGEVRELKRAPGESDVVYQARILADIRTDARALTEQALLDALNDCGGPACTSVIHRGQRRRLRCQPVTFGGVTGRVVLGRGVRAPMTSRLGLFTCSAVLEREPTPAELTALAAAARGVIPATVRLLLVTYDAVAGVYLLHREVYAVPYIPGR